MFICLISTVLGINSLNSADVPLSNKPSACRQVSLITSHPSSLPCQPTSHPSSLPGQDTGRSS